METQFSTNLNIMDTLEEIKRLWSFDFVVTGSFALSMWNYVLPHVSEDLDILITKESVNEIIETYNLPFTKYKGLKWISSSNVTVDFIVIDYLQEELNSSTPFFVNNINIAHPLKILQNKLYCAFISKNHKLDHINELCYLLENNKHLIDSD